MAREHRQNAIQCLKVTCIHSNTCGRFHMIEPLDKTLPDFKSPARDVPSSNTAVRRKICYDKAGNLPNKGRNFNTQTWGKIVYFLFV